MPRVHLSAVGPWDRFSGDEWSDLLQEQPQFADKCDWDKLTEDDWEYLLMFQPQYAGKRPKGMSDGDDREEDLDFDGLPDLEDPLDEEIPDDDAGTDEIAGGEEDDDLPDL